MTPKQQAALLVNAQTWFRTIILPNHLTNTALLKKAKAFNINPFLASYVAVFMTGQLTPESIAKALTYPRVLGTSITTSFGQNMQTFISDVLVNAFGSLIPGVDIEFIDNVDGRKKYCQIKLGPETINSADVITIHDHFKAVRNLGRTNRVTVGQHDMVVGILYGVAGQESNHYKSLRDRYDYALYVGNEFWYRLTGAEDFYDRLIHAISEVVLEAKGKELLDEVVAELAKDPVIVALANAAK